MPPRNHICLTFFSGIILPLFASICSAATLLSNGQLTVQADGVPLTAILDDIGRQGNISIQTHGTLTGQMVTTHFGPLPLEIGLKRLLKKDNYLATFDNNGNVIKLIILSKVSAPVSGGYNTLPQVAQEISAPPENTPPQVERVVPEPPENTPPQVEEVIPEPPEDTPPEIEQEIPEPPEQPEIDTPQE